jgi:hypothetical protein
MYGMVFGALAKLMHPTLATLAEDLIISQFECPNLPGFKNLAGLISSFI